MHKYLAIFVQENKTLRLIKLLADLFSKKSMDCLREVYVSPGLRHKIPNHPALAYLDYQEKLGSLDINLSEMGIIYLVTRKRTI